GGRGNRRRTVPDGGLWRGACAGGGWVSRGAGGMATPAGERRGDGDRGLRGRQCAPAATPDHGLRGWSADGRQGRCGGRACRGHRGGLGHERGRTGAGAGGPGRCRAQP
ncbi:hypothetical protein LTR94_035997, partial [Friedmanniomyces endolithicus]